MLLTARAKEIGADYIFTADTGAEDDCVTSDGRRLSAREFFESSVLPIARAQNIPAFFIRAKNKHGEPLPSLWEAANAANYLPLFGSMGGRNRQTCTDKWKVRAMKQRARELGATHARAAIGIHYGEAARRVSGNYLFNENGFDIYRTIDGAKRPVKWLSHFYPLVDWKIDRDAARLECVRLGVPYIVSSQCDFCPHQDIARWERHAPEKLHQIAAMEKAWRGEYFFTDNRKPLLEALSEKRARRSAKELDVACESSVCFI